MLTCLTKRSPRRVDSVVDRHAQAVYRVAHHLVGAAPAAAEVTEGALRRILRACWLTSGSAQVVAMRATVDAARERASRAPDAGGTSLLGGLPLEERAALVLHDVEGLPYPRAARAMRLSVPRFKRLLNAARLCLASRRAVPGAGLA